MQSVSHSFWRGSTEVPALQSASLEVEAGELVAVYGKRASGKTTLLKVAAGLERADRGSVRFDGIDLRTSSPGQIARLHRNEIGWVDCEGPQSRELPMRVHVALSLYREIGSREAQQRGVASLDKVGVAGCGDQRWDDLSDGERVLVAIAKALTHEPRLLVVDAPTQGLGITEREEVVGLLRSTAEKAGTGVLMAVPDMPAVLSAHRVLLLSRGRLVSPSDLDSDEGSNVIRFPRATADA